MSMVELTKSTHRVRLPSFHRGMVWGVPMKNRLRGARRARISVMFRDQSR